MNRKPLKICIIAGIALLLCIVGILMLSPMAGTKADAPGQTATEPQLGLSDLDDIAKSLKSELSAALDDIKNDDLDSARGRMETVLQYIHSVEDTVARIQAIPFLKKSTESVQQLLRAAKLGVEKIALPGIDLLEAHPLSALRVDGGIHVKQLCIYLDFAQSVIPDVEQILQSANAMDLSIIDSDGKIAGYLEQANGLMEIYRRDPEILSTLKSMLGAEEDRLYLLAAQSSSEIRASGGFPGVVGTVRIQDGVLTLGSFLPVNSILSQMTSDRSNITDEERRLFHHQSGIRTPRDSCLCPDFERVAELWSYGYEELNYEPVAGVISMTPHIVQRLLAAADREITLSDGSVLNGETATRVLQYDLYFKYFGRYSSIERGKTGSDEMFVEAAEKTLEEVLSNLSVSHMLNYLSVAKESFGDRTMMLWMKDPREQAFIARMGWNAGLNTDPQAPEAGIYYNCIVASKLGWFLLIDAQVGEPAVNADGSRTYPMTVTFTNTITQEEIDSASLYIRGMFNGSIFGAAYFFAPAGGTVGDFKASNDLPVVAETYGHLTLGFLDEFLIAPGSSVTVTYTVTTAPGVDAPLEISQTPTAQQF